MADGLDFCVTKRLVLLGSKNSGKSSILKTLTDDQDLNVLSGCELTPAFISFDFPVSSQPIDLLTELSTRSGSKDSIFHNASAVIYVLDLKENLIESTYSLCNLFIWYLSHFKDSLDQLSFFVLIHKSDTISVDLLLQAIEDVQSMCLDTVGESLKHLRIEYFTTSIFDSSVNIAFGCVLQKILYHMKYISQLLQIFTQKTKASSSMLVDGLSRLILAKEIDRPEFLSAETLLQLLDIFYDLEALNKPSHAALETSNMVLNFSKIIFKDGDTVFLVEIKNSLCLMFKKTVDVAECQKYDEKVLENAKVFADCLFKMISSVKLSITAYDTF